MTTALRVSVQCHHCLTAASVFQVNADAWIEQHQSSRHPDEAMCYTVVPRASDRWPQSVIEAEQKRAAESTGANATPFALVDGDRVTAAAPSHPPTESASGGANGN